MGCDNEFCDPEIGHDCAECFKKRNARLSHSEALSVRNTSEFQTLEAKLSAAYAEIDAVYAMLNKSYPLEEDYYWVGYGRCPSFRLMPIFAPVIEE